MADAVIVSTARTPIGKAFRGVFNDTHGADMGAHVDQARRRARQGRARRGRGRDPGLRRAGRHDGLQRRPRLGDARRRAGQRLGRHGEPLLLVGPADHLDGRPARAGRQGAGDDRRRPRVRLAGAGPAGRQQEPPGQSLGAGARARHLPRHDHHRRHGGRRATRSAASTQDEYSLQSQLRTAAAQQAGKFDDEIVPMETTMLVTDKNTNEVSKKTVKLTKDEGNRPDTNRRASPSCSR